MPTYNMEMVLEWAKVFPENADMGNPDGPRAAQAIHKKGGQYIVNAYFTSQDQIDKLLEDGLDPHPMNSNRLVQGNPEFGIGTYMKLKREVADNIKEFEGKGGTQVVNFGGPVGVLNITDGIENKREWNLEEDGLIGNGSKCRVLVAVYDAGRLKGTRLEAVQVVDHIPYVSEGGGQPTGGGLNGFFKDLTAETKAAPSAPVKAKKAAAAVAEDEIPF